MTEDPLERRVRSRLDRWEADGLLRVMRPPSGVDFSSNDYLNLSTHPRILERLARAAADGCGSTGSRLLRGDRDLFHAVEARCAAFKGTDAALYFSSGYLANIAVTTALMERGDVVFSDAHNHASLVDGIRLSRATVVVFPHNDVEALAERLEHTSIGPDGHRFVVVESVFSMDGDLGPLVEYAAICRRWNASLVVDEAHAFGVYGTRGSGLVEALGLAADVTVSINAAGKALGVGGSFVCGPSWAIDYLIQRARPFVFTTAAPPPLAAAIDAAFDVIADEPDRRLRLAARVSRLRERLADAGVDVAVEGSQIVPVMIGENRQAVNVAALLQADGFDVRAIRPPTVPAGTARLRVSVNAGLDEDVIDRFARSLITALGRIGRCAAVSS